VMNEVSDRQTTHDGSSGFVCGLTIIGPGRHRLR